MLTFKPGIYLDCRPTRVDLRFFGSGGGQDLDVELRQELEQVALGALVDTDALSEATRPLFDAGWIVEAEDVGDPVLDEALGRLDRRFAWAGGPALEAYALLRKLHTRRRRLLRSVGQYPALPETGARRVALVGKEPQRVLLIGDDDLLALPLAAAGHDVTIVDIDPYLIDFTQRQAEAHGLAVTARRWDARLALPEALVGAFDVVLTDPMSSAAALPLFVDRAIAALRDGGKLWVCVNSPATRVFDVCRRETGLALVSHHSDFNHYYSAAMTLAGYVSDMYGLEKTEATRPTRAANEHFTGTGLFNEEHYGVRQSSRFVIRDVDPERTELVHLQALLNECERLGDFKVKGSLRAWDEHYRSIVALLEGGVVLTLTAYPAERRVEMLLTPPYEEIELIVEGALLALYNREDTSHTVVRVRNHLATELVT